jgi:hypothetical protein
MISRFDFGFIQALKKIYMHVSLVPAQCVAPVSLNNCSWPYAFCKGVVGSMVSRAVVASIDNRHRLFPW